MGRGYSGLFPEGGRKKYNKQCLDNVPNRHSTLAKNVNKMKDLYPITEHGYFGAPGKSSGVRVIYSETPEQTSKDFYIKISKGGKREQIKNSAVIKTTLSDGTIITYRETSKSGSPAVDINIVAPGSIKGQKIHFEKGD